MPRGKNFKMRVRARMRATGERYTQAREKLRSIGGGAPAGVQGWILAGTNPADYEMGIETDLTYQGGRVAYLRSVAKKASGFGTVMQTISGDDYRDRRVRFSAAVQAQDIESWAGLWMRVDGHTTDAPLAFDNMQNRPLRGSFDWRSVGVVLDVPSEATAVAFGLLLTGRGAVQMSQLRLEVVDQSVPVTNTYLRPRQPINLDFSQGEAGDQPS